QRLVLVAREEQDGGAKVLVEIRRMDVTGERAALSPVGREQDDLAVAALHVRRKDSGDPAAGHGLAENQMAIGEVEADILLDQREVADPVAFVAVETVLADGARDVGGGRARQGRTEQQREKYDEGPTHDPSLL